MNNSKYTKIVAKALKEFLIYGQTDETERLCQDKTTERRACFVTLKTKSGKLRGCIGTLQPQYRNLCTELIRNAVAAASRDTRFPPVKAEELPELNISVEILSDPEEITADELPDPKEHGLIIEETETGRRGVLLPNIEGITNSKEQVAAIKRKAGIHRHGLAGLKFYRFTTDKYY